MRTLTDEQLEDVLAGITPLSDTATQDDIGRYNDLKAVRARMVSAFQAIPAPVDFQERLKDNLTLSQTQHRRKTIRFPFRLAACGSLAAGIIAACLPVNPCA